MTVVSFEPDGRRAIAGGIARGAAVGVVRTRITGTRAATDQDKETRYSEKTHLQFKLQPQGRASSS